jgi:integrase
VARIGHARLPAEAETVALYVADLKRRGRRPATIARKLPAIAVYHRSVDHPTPTDHDVVRALVRSCAAPAGNSAWRSRRRPRSSSAPLGIPEDLRGLRDRALLLFGWAAALRRSELAALRVDDVHFEPEGAVLTIRRSKTDQDAAGETVAVPFGEEEATPGARPARLARRPRRRGCCRRRRVRAHRSPWQHRRELDPNGHGVWGAMERKRHLSPHSPDETAKMI